MQTINQLFEHLDEDFQRLYTTDSVVHQTAKLACLKGWSEREFLIELAKNQSKYMGALTKEYMNYLQETLPTEFIVR